jgi:uncharacterized iron-regulated protein
LEKPPNRETVISFTGADALKRVMRLFLLSSLCLFLLVLPLRAAVVTADQLVLLAGADVVILGEVHDNPHHHQNQAELVHALQPAALVFEMLTQTQSDQATGAVRRDAAALEQALGWAGTGWPDFSLYAPIFLAAPTAQLFGANLPRALVRKSITDGAADVFGPDAPLYGLTTPLSKEDQTAQEAEQMAAHCNALPETLLPGMVEAQRLRDAALARAVIRARAATGGGQVVVITGNGHARTDWGLSVPLSRVLAGEAPTDTPAPIILAVGQFETAAPDDPPFDLVLVTDAVERDDPCAAFKKP